MIYKDLNDNKFPIYKQLNNYSYFLRVVENNEERALNKAGDWLLYHKVNGNNWEIFKRGHGKDEYRKLLLKLQG